MPQVDLTFADGTELHDARSEPEVSGRQPNSQAGNTPLERYRSPVADHEDARRALDFMGDLQGGPAGASRGDTAKMPSSRASWRACLLGVGLVRPERSALVLSSLRTGIYHLVKKRLTMWTASIFSSCIQCTFAVIT